jgi:hypothetical protein
MDDVTMMLEGGMLHNAQPIEVSSEDERPRGEVQPTDDDRETEIVVRDISEAESDFDTSELDLAAELADIERRMHRNVCPAVLSSSRRRQYLNEHLMLRMIALDTLL